MKKTNKKYLFITSIFLLSMVGIQSSFAGVMINNTRVIFEQKYKSANVTLTNVTDSNYAVQVWINGESDRQDEKLPFVATPAIFRLGPGQEQIVKILSLQGTLPQDRESVFYFNAQEIPAVNKNDQSNKLVMAIRTRIKLFYRPSNLETTSIKAPKTLQWKRVDREGKSWLLVTNPSPYHVTFGEMNFRSGSQHSAVNEAAMLSPRSSQYYPLPGNKLPLSGGVSFSVINDYGGITRYENTPVQ